MSFSKHKHHTHTTHIHLIWLERVLWDHKHTEIESSSNPTVICSVYHILFHCHYEFSFISLCYPHSLDVNRMWLLLIFTTASNSIKLRTIKSSVSFVHWPTVGLQSNHTQITWCNFTPGNNRGVRKTSIKNSERKWTLAAAIFVVVFSLFSSALTD